MSINWDTSRMGTSVIRTSTTDTNPIILSLANRMSITTSQGFDPLHGMGEGEFNNGYVRRVPSYNWSITFPANSKHIRLFRAMFEAKESFTIKAYDTKSTTVIEEIQFQPIEETLINARITSMDQGYEIADTPVISFSGVALGYDFKSVDTTDSNNIIAADEIALEETDAEGETYLANKVLGNGWIEVNQSINKKLFSDIW